MKEELENIKQSFLEEIKNCKDINSLEEIRVKYLGKKGQLTLILRNMGSVSPEDRPKVGQMVNEVRGVIENELASKKEIIENEQMMESIKNAKRFDFTVPVDNNLGSLHPIPVVQR